jgi:hypothetical protein
MHRWLVVNVRKLFLLNMFRIFGGLAMSLLFVRNLAGPSRQSIPFEIL